MNITAEAQDPSLQRWRNKRLTVGVMVVFVGTLGGAGYLFDVLTGTFKGAQLITVPVAIILIGSILNNFFKGMAQRCFHPDSTDYGHFKMVNWLLWTGFVVIVWEVFVLGQAFFESKTLLTLPETAPYGVAVGCGIGIATAFSTLQWGMYAILRSVQALPADEANACDRRLLQEVQTLSRAASIPVPNVYILLDDSPNAFSLGRSPGHACLVVTQGLMDLLSPEELKGVLAHEIAHIKNYDIRLRTAITALFGSVLLVSHSASHAATIGISPHVRLPGIGGVKRSLLLLCWGMTLFVAPIAAYAVVAMTSRYREYIADVSAAALAGDPGALAHALERIQESIQPSTLVSGNIAHLCIIDPSDRRMNRREGFWANLFATHPPTEKRIQLLQALAVRDTL